MPPPKSRAGTPQTKQGARARPPAPAGAGLRGLGAPAMVHGEGGPRAPICRLCHLGSWPPQKNTDRCLFQRGARVGRFASGFKFVI